MRVVAAGLSFRDAPLAVREAAAVDGDAGRNLLRYLVGHAGAAAAAGDMSGRGVLLVGGGEVSDLAARRLHALGSRLLITSRGESKERLARAFGAEAVPMSELAEAAERFDVVIASTGSSGIVLDEAMVAAVQARRGQRPLCLVDLAVPRDVDAAAGVVAGVTLIDIDEVGRRLEARNRQRGAALAAAEQIVEVELGRTVKVLEQRDASAPAISALTRRAEEMRRRELEQTLARVPELDAAARERIDDLTQSLVRKLLHEPVAYLRDSVDDPSVALLLREAFGLD